ncbi:MAG: hypothetical protein AAF141_05600 [Pseudomonadota bacterium]
MKIIDRRRYYAQKAKELDERAWQEGCAIKQGVAEHYKQLAAMDEPPVPF